MSIQSICKYLFILLFSARVVCGSLAASAQTADTVSTDTTDVQKTVKKPVVGRQLCIGIDVAHPVMNSLVNDRFGYEFNADFYMHNEMYLAAEGGWGGSTVDYTDLKYTTKNNFLRFGFNRSILNRDRPNDWDIMFVGFRAAVADVNRSAATFTVVDSVWGNTQGSSGAKTFLAYWAEITGGMRVEFWKGICAGWNVRGKFMLNGRSFNDLAPLNIAGYGKGDKNVAFDFNLYLSYGIRWNRKTKETPVVKETTK